MQKCSNKALEKENKFELAETKCFRSGLISLSGIRIAMAGSIELQRNYKVLPKDIVVL